MSVKVVVLHEHVVPGKRLGRNIEHDPASRAYEAVAPAAVKLTARVWPRGGKPFDQGDLGSCTGNAIAGVLNTGPFRRAHKPLATEQDAVRLYEEATKLDSIQGSYPPDDTGSSGLAACKAAQREHRIASYHHAFNVQAALAAIMAGPVITGVNWYEGFDTPDGDGHVTIGGQVRGGHEFEIVGYDPGHGDPLDGIVQAWNSWGTSYGKGGRFFFTARTWAQLLDEQGDVTVPLPVV